MRDYKELYREAKGDMPRIYVDMDGVLCDFVKQAEKATGMSIDAWMKEPKKNFKSI